MTDENTPSPGLGGAYALEGPEDASRFYDAWAEDYDADLAESGYATPRRCAEALAAHATLPWAPVMDLCCGTGLSGLALHEAGFECVDGFDISEGMLEKAREKGIYRELAVADLSKPLDIDPNIYQNAAAVGCISPEHMPPTVLDDILAKLPEGGCLVFSLNDRAAKDGTVVARLNDLIDTGAAELLFSEHGPHIPEIGLEATVYVIRKR